jgi:Flp pilus assembly pilin Flp
MTRADSVFALPLQSRGWKDSDMLARNVREWWARFDPQDSGQDLLEYALLVALITLVAVGAITTVGNTIKTVFWDVISSTANSI